MTQADQFIIEHSTHAAASSEAIWRLFQDTARWSDWNDGVERIDLEGPFAEGTWFTMKTPDAPEALRSRLVVVRENEEFVDETRVGELVVRVAHRLEGAAEGTRITYRLVAEGEGASQIGPAIAADFPAVLLALARAASVRRAAR